MLKIFYTFIITALSTSFYGQNIEFKSSNFKENKLCCASENFCDGITSAYCQNCYAENYDTWHHEQVYNANC